MPEIRRISVNGGDDGDAQATPVEKPQPHIRTVKAEGATPEPPQDTDGQAHTQTIFRRVLPFIVCAVVMVIVLGVTTIISQGRSEQLGEQTSKISALENRKSTLEAAATKESSKAVFLASGLDSGRQAQDDLKVQGFFKTAFSWDSKESYDKARAKLKEQYGLDDNNAFFSVFMPQADDIDVGGRTINEIDAQGLNMSFKSMKSNVTKINGDRYTYFTTVTVTSSDKTGATADADAICVYTVDGSGKLSDITAYSIQ